MKSRWEVDAGDIDCEPGVVTGAVGVLKFFELLNDARPLPRPGVTGVALADPRPGTILAVTPNQPLP